jgi:hypothetical protein
MPGVKAGAKIAMELAKRLNKTGDDLITDADHIVERTKCRIAQYRHHIENMEKSGRESEGATLVLARLQRALARLQLYSKLLQHDRPVNSVVSAGNVYINRSERNTGLRPVQ